MSDQIKLLIQKRTSLKSQIVNLENLVNENKLDNTTLKLRIARLTVLYHAFEDYNDELILLDPDSSHNDEFVNIQEQFYSLAGNIESNFSSESSANSSVSVTSGETQRDDAKTLTKKRRIKLPEASLPTFDGQYENWLSLKTHLTI